jgi:hypothetical protein
MPTYNTHRVRSVQATKALEYVCNSLEAQPPIWDKARDVHVASSDTLMEAGLGVINEYPMPYVGKFPRRGRIDIYAELGDHKFAIELDARRPRQMSLIKLNSFAGMRIAATRGVIGECPDGIDAVVAIPVKMLP